MNWPKTEFENLYEIPSKNGLNRPERMRGSGYKMINMGELFAHDRIGNIEMELVPMDEKELNTMLVEKGDLLFARQSLILAGAGKCSIVKEAEEATTFESHIIRIRLNKEIANPEFYYYYFKSPLCSIKTIVTQGVQAGIRGNDLKLLPVHVPPLIDQDRIAWLLSNYDDLIENNRRRMALLEEAARQLYREWFVRLRFPGHEHTRIIDGLPEGWEQRPIGDLVLGIFDGPHATPHDAEEGPVFLGIKNITESGRLDLSTVRHIAENDFPRWTKRVLPQAGDIVFSYEATLHRYAVIPEGFRGCLGRRLALIRPDPSRRNGFFLFQSLLGERWRSTIEKNIISGATVDRIPIAKLPSFPVLVPPDHLVQIFEENVRDVFRQVQTLTQQVDKLRTARDLLLPRLMSGEIAV